MGSKPRARTSSSLPDSADDDMSWTSSPPQPEPAQQQQQQQPHLRSPRGADDTLAEIEAPPMTASENRSCSTSAKYAHWALRAPSLILADPGTDNRRSSTSRADKAALAEAYEQEQRRVDALLRTVIHVSGGVGAFLVLFALAAFACG